jgi:hypothetical protein
MESGLKITGQVRHISMMKAGRTHMFAFIRNNEPVKFYKVK